MIDGVSFGVGVVFGIGFLYMIRRQRRQRATTGSESIAPVWECSVCDGEEYYSYSDAVSHAKAQHKAVTEEAAREILTSYESLDE